MRGGKREVFLFLTPTLSLVRKRARRFEPDLRPLAPLWQSTDIKDTCLKMSASCLCVSADSLILSLHDSSVSSVCQPSALVSRFSLNPNCFGKQSRRGDRGNTSAITPPSLVLTETTDIIGTRILDETTHTHTHANTINKFPSHSYTSKHTHRLNPPLLVQPPSSFFLSLFCQPASISTSPLSVMMLSSLMSQEEVSFLLLPSLLSSFSLPALQFSPLGTRDPEQPALIPEQTNCLQQS